MKLVMSYGLLLEKIWKERRSVCWFLDISKQVGVGIFNDAMVGASKEACLLSCIIESKNNKN